MTKKYMLKPGKHQFAPGSPAVHDNDNLSDEEAEWYLEKYPHISALFHSVHVGKPKDVKAFEIREGSKNKALDGSAGLE